MTTLLDAPPYSARDDVRLLEEMQALTAWHRSGCAAFDRMWPNATPAATLADLPYVHVSVFKHLDLQTSGDGIQHMRTLLSSSTTGTGSSRVALDRRSSELQGRSSVTILSDFLGTEVRPLVILDDPRSLRMRGEMSARVAAGLSLQPLASDLAFVARSIQADAAQLDVDKLAAAIDGRDEVLMYGFTWILWVGMVTADLSDDLRASLARTRVRFVHSGGWKRLETLGIGADEFNSRLLDMVAPGSSVTDFYGLVEQVGVVYPLCDHGRRHVPRWASVIVRDPYSLQPTSDVGVIQSMNPLAWGGPYHSVLTEDQGRRHADPCGCGRLGETFDLIGRVPKAEVRGCANV